MRNVTYIVGILLSIVSCNMPEAVLPPEQKSFSNLVRIYRDSSEAVADSPGKPYLMERAVNSIKTHISDTLGFKFNKWQVRVLDIRQQNVTPGTEIIYAINIDAGPMTEKTRYQSIALQETVEKNDGTSARKDLKVGDIAELSGTFVSKNGMINMESYNDYKRSRNVLTNPLLRIEVDSISVH